MKVPDYILTESMTLLVPVFGNRETKALLRALQEDLFGPGSPEWTAVPATRWKAAIQRILGGEPLAYITGVSHFLNLKLKVNPHVLIPRPETEELAVMAIQYIKGIKHARVLDVGTGSGCLALAIKSSGPTAKVYALDIDSKALETAKANAQAYHVPIDFIPFDFLNENGWTSLPDQLDLIISNPPYIGETEKTLMSASTLLYEPSHALFAGTDPLVFYKKIARFGKDHLNPGGRIMVEINEFRARETEEVFSTAGYPGIELYKDLSGKERILVVSKLAS